MIQIMYVISMITSIIFLQMNHPLAMGMMLLTQTFFICILTGLLTKTFWFSYVLFLIFLGGMLVLFIYVTSLASNEMFSISMNLFVFSVTTLMISVIFILVSDKSIISMFSLNLEMLELNNLSSYLNENILNLNKLYNFPTNLITILLINYLLITLIAIVKVTNVFYGPLRLMN
uniref:NADH dehydrogenase subunit 6 n=1 Tax=Iteaphila macquarti TaxID=1692392 RepID=UPI0026E1984C|nr:NADH dehydrogenase subunit 6 [Iteaphila macquarti]WJW73681.1 NADH dehydrogenase subunit 6 [Iteaphila macquarti]